MHETYERLWRSERIMGLRNMLPRLQHLTWTRDLRLKLVISSVESSGGKLRVEVGFSSRGALGIDCAAVTFFASCTERISV